MQYTAATLEMVEATKTDLCADAVYRSDTGNGRGRDNGVDIDIDID